MPWFLHERPDSGALVLGRFDLHISAVRVECLIPSCHQQQLTTQAFS